ncbi:unnamed protein product [Mytilus edulis]|uniref:Integrase catalytic domain-containing protein n=2 Tax=Mytilus TaxID=6548 RepID=A0A8S3SQK9_MYTED|nr:unnamed protein product [Mytilus edulis]
MNTHQEINTLLEKTYYKLSNPGAYLGPDKLYRVLKSKGITHIGKHKVRKWLHNQDSYGLRKELRRHFTRTRVIVSGINDQFDMDLIDISNMKSENSGVSFLLVVIDIFSKYLWIKALKNKTAKVVVAALKKILNHTTFTKGRSDKGGEFNNKIMKAYLKSKNIYYFTTENSETKANFAERVIKTIKNMMYRYFTKQRSHRYINVLQDFVKTYNSTPHRSLNNIAPKDVNKENEADIWAFMYLKPKKPKQPQKFQFKVGDTVRLTKISNVFDRSYDEHFTREIFKIRKRFRMQSIPVYKISSFDNSPVSGLFYSGEMIKVNKDENSMWYIENKLKKRKRNGVIQWLVKFEGWPDKYNQWIDENVITEPKTNNR